jgi:hypothetical protein
LLRNVEQDSSIHAATLDTPIVLKVWNYREFGSGSWDKHIDFFLRRQEIQVVQEVKKRHYEKLSGYKKVMKGQGPKDNGREGG